VWSFRNLDVGVILRQHPDRESSVACGWIKDTDRSVSALWSAQDLQGGAMKRVKGLEDLNA
jgi:hypothetical protein